MRGGNGPLIVVAGLGVLYLMSSGRKAAPSAPPPPPGPPGTVPRPVLIPTPPITHPPNGRHFSDIEKAVLAPYIEKTDLDHTMLWWNTPASSFASEDPKKHVVSVTTSRGIYLRWPNHAIVTPYEYSILGHELIHVGQQRRGELATTSLTELEVPAYQTEIRIKADLDAQAAGTGLILTPANV